MRHSGRGRPETGGWFIVERISAIYFETREKDAGISWLWRPPRIVDTRGKIVGWIWRLRRIGSTEYEVATKPVDLDVCTV